MERRAGGAARRQLGPGRVPVAGYAGDAGYPDLPERARGRRTFLKTLGLSWAAATLGAPIVTCPEARAGAGEKQGQPRPPPVAPPQPSPAPPDFDDDPHFDGDIAAPEPVLEVAVVIGGEPLAVTFRDGTRTTLVVAAVVSVTQDQLRTIATDAAEHARLVCEAARAADPPEDAASFEALEARILLVLAARLGAGVVLSVSLARVREEEDEDDREDSGAPEPPAPRDAREAERDAAAAPQREGGAAADGAAAPARRRILWSPCRQPGCRTCGGARGGGGRR